MIEKKFLGPNIIHKKLDNKKKVFMFHFNIEHHQLENLTVIIFVLRLLTNTGQLFPKILLFKN